MKRPELKPEYLAFEPRTEAKESNLYAALWITLMCLFTTVTILSRYTDEPETRKVHSMFEYRGNIINGKPVLIDEHCEL